MKNFQLLYKKGILKLFVKLPFPFERLKSLQKHFIENSRVFLVTSDTASSRNSNANLQDILSISSSDFSAIVL